VTIVRASAESYCVESVIGPSAARKAGPAGDIESGRC